MSGCEILRAAQQLHYVYEGEPSQVNDYCLPILRLPPIFFEKEILRLQVPPITLGQEPFRLLRLEERKGTSGQTCREQDGHGLPGTQWRGTSVSRASPGRSTSVRRRRQRLQRRVHTSSARWHSSVKGFTKTHTTNLAGDLCLSDQSRPSGWLQSQPGTLDHHLCAAGHSD